MFPRAFVTYWLALATTLAAVEFTFPLLANDEIHPAQGLLVPRLHEIAGRLAHTNDAQELITTAHAIAAPLKVEQFADLRIFDDRSRDVLGGEMEAGLPEFLARATELSHLVGQRAHGRDLVGIERIDVGGAAYRVVITRPVSALRVLQSVSREPGPRRAMLAALVVGAFASLGFALQLSRPLRRLAETARRIRVDDISARVDERTTRRRDEVGEVARELNRALERVEAADASRRTLLRDVSHELRAPLTRLQVAAGIAGRSDRREGRPIGPELEQVQRECERLDELIGQLLNLSQLEYRSSQERKLVELDRLVSAVVEDAEPMAEERGSRVVLGENPPLRLLGEAYSLSAAVDNLVRNALLHTPPGTHVRVSVEEIGDSIQITVADDGPGVPEEFADRMFEPFVRGTDRNASPGAGIGLALVKRAVEAHGGRVEASAGTDGSGLIVRLALPRA